MSALPECCDAVVIGGGPAGAVLAGLLAAREFSCALIDDSKPRRAARLETLLPSAMEALQRCGLAEVVRSLSEPDARRHASRWDSDEWVYRDEARAGRCIDRSTFDAQLREWARARGAHVVEDATARVIDSEAGIVEVVHANAAWRLQAKAIAIASGRVAKLDPRIARLAESGPATAALAFDFQRNSRWMASDAAVAAAREGWAWRIGDHRGGGMCVVVVDDDAKGGVRAACQRVLQEAMPEFAEQCGELTSAVRANVQLREPIASAFLLGDAAAGLDPLASQGTEKALVGAENAALAIATALEDPSVLDAAVACHARWERDLFHAHRKTCASFYARVVRFAAEPFWRRRSAIEHTKAPMPTCLVRASLVGEHLVLERRGATLQRSVGYGRDPATARVRIGRVALEPLLSAFAEPRSVEDGIARTGQDARVFPLGTAPVRAAIAEAISLGLLTEC
jgi:2-polyprenyl-6-methoxyphenol hydroxylase-like FAD-dependent oxidoreductase